MPEAASRKPVELSVSGKLEMWKEEAGACPDAIEIDRRSLDVLIRKALGKETSDRIDGGLNHVIGRCELTLKIWPNDDHSASDRQPD